MGKNSSIEWCDATFNTHWGCTEISPGCDNCYARTWAARYGVKWGADAPRREFGDKHWNEPLKWARAMPSKLGRRPRVFCASMADVFDKDAPEGARERLWKLIQATPELDWLLLTKRIGNAPRMLPADWGDGYPNVWLGASIVNQEEADRDVSKLLAAPARVRFISYEPALGPIDFTKLDQGDGITLDGLRSVHEGPVEAMLARRPPFFHAMGSHLHWVISGGESGPKARPSHPDWHRALAEQCATAGVAYLFKQWGEWIPGETEVMTEPPWNAVHPDDESIDLADGRGYKVMEAHGREFIKVGKKAAGRTLDGRTHDGFPTRDARA